MILAIDQKKAKSTAESRSKKLILIRMQARFLQAALQI